MRTAIKAVICVLFLTFLSTAEAAIRDVLEPMIAELTLAFKSGDYPSTLKMAEEILSKDPNVIPALEFRAMALRASGRTEEASKAYLELVKKRWKESSDRAAVAPYYFELGNLRFKEGKLDDAKFYLGYALQWNFNPTVCRFFLGNIAIQQKDFGEAGTHFSEVAASDLTELKPPSEFFLAQVAFKRRKAGLAVAHMRRARELSQAVLDDPASTDESRSVAKKLLEAADKAMASLDKSSLFGNVSLITAYDTNVLSVPTSQSTSTESTGNGSLKETVMAAVGYATSPMSKVQLIPSYRLSYNYNFNKDTRTGSFLTQTASMLANVDALAAMSWGAKVDGTLTFQNQPESTTGNSLYKPYALSGAIGPFVKWDLESMLTLTADLTWQPQKNYLDTSVAESSRRSGNEGVARVGARWDRAEGFLNPGVTVTYDLNRSNGTEYRSKTVGVTFNDSIYVGEDLTLTPTLSFSSVRFAERASGERQDKLWVADLSGAYKISSVFSALGGVQTMRNISNVPETYEFNRTQVSGGISYSF